MQWLAHSGAARLTATLVALALGGLVPWLEAPHAEPTHRCQCARGAGHHDCDCPLCQAEAARAATSASPDAAVPPCHLAVAKKVRAAEREAAARRAASGHALSSSCGDGDHRFDPPPTVQVFLLPAMPPLAVHVAPSSLQDRWALEAGPPVEPETPPPKRA